MVTFTVDSVQCRPRNGGQYRSLSIGAQRQNVPPSMTSQLPTIPELIKGQISHLHWWIPGSSRHSECCSDLQEVALKTQPVGSVRRWPKSLWYRLVDEVSAGTERASTHVVQHQSLLAAHVGTTFWCFHSKAGNTSRSHSKDLVDQQLEHVYSYHDQCNIPCNTK